MDSMLTDLHARLLPFGQEHLLRYWNELDQAEKMSLAGQIGKIDLELLRKIYLETTPSSAGAKVSGSETPQSASGTDAVLRPLKGEAWENFPIDERASMANAGMRALREGKVAAFLVAGGQGTRLGHQGPKGTFDIGLPSRKSLFQLQAERLWKLGRMAGKPIPWYIMTSSENHAETTEFFASHSHFGLDETQIFFLTQGDLPLVDKGGRILLEDKGRISQGANGNGGCFLALETSGALSDMKAKGIDWVFFHTVDNALVKICDPRFIGFAIASDLPTASKSVSKLYPEEKVGVFCHRNGHPTVVEYSELSADEIQARGKDGNLIFNSANIAVHLFRRDFLEKEARSPLPYHAAEKKIPHLDASGLLIRPEAPNAYKFELFMFDLFPRAAGMAVLEVAREDEFAPVKNKSGADSPQSAAELLLNLHTSWAKANGWRPDKTEAKVEISPKLSYAGEGLNPGIWENAVSTPVGYALD